jgi:predicted Mrr-cat superfamily restriction endonuclease
VQVCEITSNAAYRDFDEDAKDAIGDTVDIWHYRSVKYLCSPIPIVDFFAPLKGKLLGPRGTIWQLHEARHTLSQLAGGTLAHDLLASGPELKEAFEHLRDLIVRRAHSLDDKGWEWLVADYFRAQHAHVDEWVGGTRAVIDIEASFDHGELGETVWHVQVKRYQNCPTDKGDLEYLLSFGGDEARLCFVSVFGFTERARTFADENNIRLLEASDFVRFLLGNKVRAELMMKLRLPIINNPVSGQQMNPDA